MNTTGKGDTFASLQHELHQLRLCLMRFYLFWTREGRIASIETICEWMIQSAPLIDRFLYVQEEIGYYLVEGSVEEQHHISLTEDFQILYSMLMKKIQRLVDDYVIRKCSRL